MKTFTDARRFVLILSLMTVLPALGILLWAGTAEAHNYVPNKQWNYPSVTPNTTNADTSYATQISSAASDYRNNTDLYVSHCSGTCSGSNIRHYEADYGITSWAARALYSGNVISYATIQWNGHTGGLSPTQSPTG